MTNLTENEIIDQAFYLSELDVDVWETDSDEYSLARGFLNDGINRWENFENTKWRDLIATNSIPLTTAHSYNCASGMAYPGSWVRTGEQFWTIVKPENIAQYSGDDAYYCYFLGNKKDGYTLNFNSRLDIPTGTADFEYYKKAFKTTAPTDQVEMSDPSFLSYWIASKLGEDGMNIDLFNIAEDKLKTMRILNMSGYFGVPDLIENSITDSDGFGV